MSFCQHRLRLIVASERARAPPRSTLFSLPAFHDGSLRSIDEHFCVYISCRPGGTMIPATVASNTIHATRCRTVTRMPRVCQLATTDRQIHGSREVPDKNRGNGPWTCVRTRECEYRAASSSRISVTDQRKVVEFDLYRKFVSPSLYLTCQPCFQLRS